MARGRVKVTKNYLKNSDREKSWQSSEIFHKYIYVAHLFFILELLNGVWLSKRCLHIHWYALQNIHVVMYLNRPSNRKINHYDLWLINLKVLNLSLFVSMWCNNTSHYLQNVKFSIHERVHEHCLAVYSQIDMSQFDS